MNKTLGVLVLASAIGLGGCAITPTPAKPTGQQVAQIQIGQTRDEVRRLLGPPVSAMVLPRLRQEVWTYKYYDVTAPRRHMELYVYFDVAGETVRRTEAATDRDFDPGGAGGRS
jgi:outer membrane protein assembly factor BamE (lipoprotein component of BamABCDE complex)